MRACMSVFQESQNGANQTGTLPDTPPQKPPLPVHRQKVTPKMTMDSFRYSFLEAAGRHSGTSIIIKYTCF